MKGQRILATIARAASILAKRETKKCVSLRSVAMLTIGRHFVMERLLVVSILSG